MVNVKVFISGFSKYEFISICIDVGILYYFNSSSITSIKFSKFIKTSLDWKGSFNNTYCAYKKSQILSKAQ